MLVIDASMAVDCATHDNGFAWFDGHELVGPALLWSEVRSTLHEARWRGHLSSELTDLARRRFAAAPISLRSLPSADRESWAIADELGLAKTYDGEYLALARLLGCRVVTVDARLRRGADRLGLVIGPTEL